MASWYRPERDINFLNLHIAEEVLQWRVGHEVRIDGTPEKRFAGPSEERGFSVFERMWESLSVKGQKHRDNMRKRFMVIKCNFDFSNPPWSTYGGSALCSWPWPICRSTCRAGFNCVLSIWTQAEFLENDDRAGAANFRRTGKERDFHIFWPLLTRRSTGDSWNYRNKHWCLLAVRKPAHSARSWSWTIIICQILDFWEYALGIPLLVCRKV